VKKTDRVTETSLFDRNWATSFAPETQQGYQSQRCMLDEKNLKYHLNQLEVWNGVNKSLND
jgi:hypothetical protein